MLHSMRDDPTTQIFVFFEEEPKVGVKPIRRWCIACYLPEACELTPALGTFAGT